MTACPAFADHDRTGGACTLCDFNPPMTDPPTEPASGLERAADAATPVGADPAEAVVRHDRDDEARALHAWGERIALLDERDRLRARVDELETTVSILEDSEPFSYDDCRDDCDGCHESALMCDCHVPATEARARIRDLRDRVEAGEHAIADVLALCREIRPDSVLGTSPAVRLKLIEDRLTLSATPTTTEA